LVVLKSSKLETPYPWDRLVNMFFDLIMFSSFPLLEAASVEDEYYFTPKC